VSQLIRTLVALSGGLLLVAAASAQSLVAADEQLLAEYRSFRAELPGTATAAAPRQATAGQSFLLPYFEIDRNDPSGQTSLIGVRNVLGQPTPVTVTYHDRTGAAVRVDARTLGPAEVLSVNLRDVPGLGTEGDGFARGFAIVDTAGAVSADSLHVDPSQDFATGERLVSLAGATWCRVWDLRYINGSAFSGGTVLTMLLGDPRDTQLRNGNAGAAFEVFDEAGAYWGVVYYFSNLAVTRVAVADILAALPAAPENGALEVTFMPGTGGGLVLADYRAQGRYAVSLPGSCVVE
jgi:hypothetical protein